MLKHILIPLDGSHLAEMALPTAALLAQKLDAAVTLIHVIEHNAPQSVHGDRHLTNQMEAKENLAQMAHNYFPSSIQVECHVHTEEIQNVAASIVGHIGEFKPDLIVMCAHGNSGLHDFMVGNIAQQVIANGKTPLLLLRPDKSGDTPVINHILVALDGIPEHETGLPLVARLATAFSASLLLVQVVPTLGTLSGNQAASGRLLPGTTSVILDIAESEAEAHLAQHAAEWQTVGLQVQTEIRRGDPAPEVVSAAKNSDLIVLGTHGKAGMHAFWSGSVASKIITQTHLPILLIPVNLILP